MALVLADRVKETTTTAGTGAVTLAGASAGFQTFSSTVGNGNTTYYVIAGQGTSEWEVGIGTYTSAGNTLARTTVLSSSNAGALVTFSSGTKDVWVDYAAGKAVTTDTLAYPPEIGGTTPAAGTFTTLTATGQTSLGGAAGANNFRVLGTTGTINYWQAVGGDGATTNPRLSVEGTSGNTSAQIASKGTGVIQFITGGTSNLEQMRVGHTASAVNYVQVTGAATGGTPIAISAQGSDASVNMTVRSKGNGYVGFTSGGGSGILLGLPNGSANYFTAGSSNTGNGVQFAAAGSDTNISQVFQSKGTGAIDLAAGSSGVNISNGGTVTALTRTSSGSSYTTIPSVVITAPTTAGGVQATATVTAVAFGASPTITSGGTGYTVGDLLTFVGGTFTGSSNATVTTVSSGVITGITYTNYGQYTVLPTNPISVTGGTGTGATFTINNWGIGTIFTITAAGSGYVEQPTVSFSGGGGSGAAAYTTVGGQTILRSLGSPMSFYTGGGEAFRISDVGATTSAYWQIFGGTTTPILRAIGSASGQIQTGGATPLQFMTNNGAQEQLRVAHTASAVNYVQVTGGATGGNPVISTQGSDGSRGLTFWTKGSTNFNFLSNSGSNTTFVMNGNAGTAVNYLQVANSATTVAPSLSAQGTDTNIDLTLTPKGTGVTRAQGSAFSAENGIIMNATTVNTNATIATGYNAHSIGPMTIASGVSVTVNSGQIYLVI